MQDFRKVRPPDLVLIVVLVAGVSGLVIALSSAIRNDRDKAEARARSGAVAPVATMLSDARVFDPGVLAIRQANMGARLNPLGCHWRDLDVDAEAVSAFGLSAYAPSAPVVVVRDAKGSVVATLRSPHSAAEVEARVQAALRAR